VQGWRFVVGRVITYAALFRIRQCLWGPRMEEVPLRRLWSNGGRMKTPAEAGLQLVQEPTLRIHKD
jgi:hypothetical protein